MKRTVRCSDCLVA